MFWFVFIFYFLSATVLGSVRFGKAVTDLEPYLSSCATMLLMFASNHTFLHVFFEIVFVCCFFYSCGSFHLLLDLRAFFYPFKFGREFVLLLIERSLIIYRHQSKL